MGQARTEEGGMSGHGMNYRAGTSGLEAIGVRSDVAHWYCTCGAWRFTAHPMPQRKSGNNVIEARRSWTLHAASSSAGHAETGGAS
jgi:hypothetical protein